MTIEELHQMYNGTSTETYTGSDEIESYEAWLERQLISRISRLKIVEGKAKAWDDLYAKIDKCYPTYDNENNELPTEYEQENDSKPDLLTIGEIAASSLGFL